MKNRRQVRVRIQNTLGVSVSSIEDLVTGSSLFAQTAETVRAEQWAEWAVARWYSSRQFLALLEHAAECAHSFGFTRLHDVLIRNLNEERGEGGDESHEEWRARFYEDIFRLANYVPVGPGMELPYSEAGSQYEEVLRELRTDEQYWSPYSVAGAVLYVEASIPTEFRLVLSRLEMCFPDLFAYQEGVDPMMPVKWQRRHYLDDHIDHDLIHYGELLGALTDAVVEDETRRRTKLDTSEALLHVQAGIFMASKAKSDLYRRF